MLSGHYRQGGAAGLRNGWRKTRVTEAVGGKAERLLPDGVLRLPACPLVPQRFGRCQAVADRAGSQTNGQVPFAEHTAMPIHHAPIGNSAGCADVDSDRGATDCGRVGESTRTLRALPSRQGKFRTSPRTKCSTCGMHETAANLIRL